MRLFAPDLYRNFGIGFALGAAVIFGANVIEGNGAVASPAQAAELIKAPAPTEDFVIAPVQG
ncbi:hypothetical protein ACLBKU_05480 [Erythrobacter sp. NE805]|uniref:hypothetical protein n=1 Tax=Erythrobacter sp. NE805 TaxID=3389875 RepID=UPI00396AF601